MNRSAWWFVLPLVLGTLGTVIACAKIKNDDPDMTKWIVIIGIVLTIIHMLAGGMYLGIIKIPL